MKVNWYGPALYHAPPSLLPGEERFVQAITVEPRERTTRLVYADWLRDRDDELRADAERLCVMYPLKDWAASPDEIARCCAWLGGRPAASANHRDPRRTSVELSARVAKYFSDELYWLPTLPPHEAVIFAAARLGYRLRVYRYSPIPYIGITLAAARDTGNSRESK